MRDLERWLREVVELLVFLEYLRSMFQVRFIFPCFIGVIISFPMDKVVGSSSTYLAVSLDMVYFVLFCSFDEVWQWFGMHRAVDVILHIGS